MEKFFELSGRKGQHTQDQINLTTWRDRVLLIFLFFLHERLFVSQGRGVWVHKVDTGPTKEDLLTTLSFPVDSRQVVWVFFGFMTD